MKGVFKWLLNVLFTFLAVNASSPIHVTQYSIVPPLSKRLCSAFLILEFDLNLIIFFWMYNSTRSILHSLHAFRAYFVTLRIVWRKWVLLRVDEINLFHPFEIWIQINSFHQGILFKPNLCTYLRLWLSSCFLFHINELFCSWFSLIRSVLLESRNLINLSSRSFLLLMGWVRLTSKHWT